MLASPRGIEESPEGNVGQIRCFTPVRWWGQIRPGCPARIGLIPGDVLALLRVGRRWVLTDIFTRPSVGRAESIGVVAAQL